MLFPLGRIGVPTGRQATLGIDDSEALSTLSSTRIHGGLLRLPTTQ